MLITTVEYCNSLGKRLVKFFAKIEAQAAKRNTHGLRYYNLAATSHWTSEYPT